MSEAITTTNRSGSTSSYSDTHILQNNTPPTHNWLDQLSLVNALSDSPNFFRALSEAELTFTWLRAHFTLLLDAFNEAATSGQIFLKSLKKLSNSFNASTLPPRTSNLFTKIPPVNLPNNQFYTVKQMLTSVPNNLERLTNQIRSLINQLIIQVKNDRLAAHQKQIDRICKLRTEFVVNHSRQQKFHGSRTITELVDAIKSSSTSKISSNRLINNQKDFQTSTWRYLTALRSGLTDLTVETYIKTALNCLDVRKAPLSGSLPSESLTTSQVTERLSKNCELWIKAQKKTSQRIDMISRPNGSAILEGYLFERSGKSYQPRRWYCLSQDQLLVSKNSQGLLSLSNLDDAYRNCVDRLTDFFSAESTQPDFPTTLAADLQQKFIQPLIWQIVEPDLRRCTVLCNRENRFTFELSGTRRKPLCFEAESIAQCNKWINLLSTGVSFDESTGISPSAIVGDGESSDRTRSDTEADSNDKQRVETRIWTHPDNKQCADCGKLDADWASVNLGVTLCAICAAAHRKLGISEIQSLILDRWEPQQLHVMLNLGNRIVNQIYEVGSDEASQQLSHRQASPTSINSSVASSQSTPISPSTPIEDSQRFDWTKSKWVKRQFLWSPQSPVSIDDSVDQPEGQRDDSVSKLVSWVNRLYNSWVDLCCQSRYSSVVDGDNDSSPVVEAGPPSESHRLKQLLVNALTSLSPRQASDPRRQWASLLLASGSRIGCPPIIMAGLACGAKVDELFDWEVLERPPVSPRPDRPSPPSNVRRGDQQPPPPLICAVKSGSLAACELLLLNGADINIRDSNGQTPLHHACLLEKVYLVCLLLKRHADTQLNNNQGQTPLDLAIKQTNPDIETLLRLYQLNESTEESDTESKSKRVSALSNYYSLHLNNLDPWNNIQDSNHRNNQDSREQIDTPIIKHQQFFP